MIDVADLFLFLKGYGVLFKNYFGANFEWLPAVIVGMFTFVNSVRILAYVPQMITAAKDENGASGISYTTWALFLLSHLTTIAYAIVCLGDLVLALIFFGNVVACTMIIGITYIKRKKHKVDRQRDHRGALST